MAIAIRNRQCLAKVNIRLLRELAARVLSIITDCRVRSSPRSTWPRSVEGVRGKGFAPPRSQTSGGQPFGLPALQNLSIVLVNDTQIAALNAQYHATPGPTDILSFDYGEGQGELIISVEHVVANARRFRTTPARELTRYIAHGILHLHGYDDHTPRQRTRMRAAERRLLNRITASMHLTSLVR